MSDVDCMTRRVPKIIDFGHAFKMSDENSGDIFLVLALYTFVHKFVHKWDMNNDIMMLL